MDLYTFLLNITKNVLQPFENVEQLCFINQFLLSVSMYSGKYFASDSNYDLLVFF